MTAGQICANAQDVTERNRIDAERAALRQKGLASRMAVVLAATLSG